MIAHAVRRIVQAVPLLVAISLLVFGLIHLAPGGPLTLYLSNPNVRPEDIERLRHALGLDRPLWEQYWSWLAAFARGDWGYSFADGRPVADRILERAPASLELIVSSLMVALLLAVPAGIAGAVRRGGPIDRSVTLASFAGISLPVFWFGLLLQLVFAAALGWLPSAGRTTFGDGGVLDRIRHLVLPASVLALVHAASWSRYLRASMSVVLTQPYIVAARSRGVPPARVLFKHALRNALCPFVTVASLDAALLVSGAIVTESVFAWPGVGSLFTDALARRDYTVLMAFLMLAAVAVILANLAADLVCRALDPRVEI